MNTVVQVPVSLLLLLAVAFLVNITFRWFELKASIRRETRREEGVDRLREAHHRQGVQVQETIDHQYDSLQLLGKAIEALQHPLVSVTDESATSSKEGREPWSDHPEDDEKPITWRDGAGGPGVHF